jgi:excisionase family DNA binding protein
LIRRSERSEERQGEEEMQRETEGLMGVDDLAVKFDVSRSFIYRAVGSGELKCVRLSARAIRFEPREVEEYIRKKSGRCPSNSDEE